MYALRDYQSNASEAGIKNLRNYENPFVLVLPTGSGKSLVISDMCRKLNEPVLILQPSREILEQNYAKLLSYGIADISIYSASCQSKEIAKYTYATIGSIYKKPELFTHFKKVLLDECHLVNPKNLGGMYNQFFKAIDCKRICGLTATPYRIVQKYYTDTEGELWYTAHLSTLNRIHPFFFKKFAHITTIENLLAQNYLCKLEYKYYDDFDVSQIKLNTTGADYDESSLEKFWSDDRLRRLAEIITEVDAQCRSNLIFCSSIKQARQCCEMLRQMGLSVDYITSENTAQERESLIERFRTKEVKHMVNVGVLTVGFDFPELDCITLARPTISLALLYQMVGRGLRVSPGKERCLVIDITNNIERLGRIETIKLSKEKDGFRDIVMTEFGEITGKPLFKFKVKNSKKIEQITKNMEVK